LLVIERRRIDGTRDRIDVLLAPGSARERVL